MKQNTVHMRNKQISRRVNWNGKKNWMIRSNESSHPCSTAHCAPVLACLALWWWVDRTICVVNPPAQAPGYARERPQFVHRPEWSVGNASTLPCLSEHLITSNHCGSLTSKGISQRSLMTGEWRLRFCNLIDSILVWSFLPNCWRRRHHYLYLPTRGIWEMKKSEKFWNYRRNSNRNTNDLNQKTEDSGGNQPSSKEENEAKEMFGIPSLPSVTNKDDFTGTNGAEQLLIDVGACAWFWNISIKTISTISDSDYEE